MKTKLLVLAGSLAVLTPHLVLAGETSPPTAPVEVVTDDYYGTRVDDPYRWMESGSDPRWMPWLKAQADHTAAVMTRIPGRDGLFKSIQALSGDQVAVGMVRQAGRTLFIQRRDVGGEDPKLYVRIGRMAERVLVDPATILGTAQALDWWVPSPDGRHVALGLSKRGTEASVLHVIETATGKLLPTRIPATDFGQVEWLPDASGFAYLQFTGEQGTPSYYLNNVTKLHRLGTKGQDKLLYDRTKAPVKMAPNDFGFIAFDQETDTAMFGVFDGRRETKLYLTDRSALLAGKPEWRRVGDFEAQIEGSEVLGTDLWVKTTKGAPNGKLLVTPLAAPNLATAREIKLPGNPVIGGITAAGGAMLVDTIEGGQNGLWRVKADGTATRIALPFAGSARVLSKVEATGEAYVSLTGWLTPNDVYHLAPNNTLHKLNLTRAPAAYDPDRYEARSLVATARDGTRVPYTVLSRKGRAAQGPGPLLIEAYGSYGAPMLPGFQTSLIPFLDRGGSYVMANVRGGGEFGRDWHYGGKAETKANTWNDAIDVAETLVRDKLTSPALMSIIGTSAGGVMVGQAVNVRPDLFTGAIANVGFMNPVRYVSEQNNADIPEWGGPITDAKTFKTMFDLDPYQHIKPGTKYPATLVVSGLNDPRAATFHSAKYMARMAAATTSGEPVLLRIDFGAGHGMGSTRSQRDAMWADIYSFVLWQAGEQAFQPN
jgi:prolyl oligopeptidase